MPRPTALTTRQISLPRTILPPAHIPVATPPLPQPVFPSSSPPSVPHRPLHTPPSSTTKFLRTVLGVDHILKSFLLTKVPCFHNGCKGKSAGRGTSYCEKHGCRMMVTAEHRCPAENLPGPSPYCEMHTCCIMLGCSKKRANYKSAHPSDYCTNHICCHPRCSNPRLEGQPLCTQHIPTCSAFSCVTPALHGSYCIAHHCISVGCQNAKFGGGEFCLDHLRCEVPECTQYRDLTRDPGYYCMQHAPVYCVVVNCGNHVAGEQVYCPVHGCAFKGCDELRGVIDGALAPCCQIHVCVTKGCRRTIRKAADRFCESHECVDPRCDNEAALPHSKFCTKHMCLVTDGLLSWQTGRTGCREHAVLFPAPLNTKNHGQSPGPTRNKEPSTGGRERERVKLDMNKRGAPPKPTRVVERKPLIVRQTDVEKKLPKVPKGLDILPATMYKPWRVEAELPLLPAMTYNPKAFSLSKVNSNSSVSSSSNDNFTLLPTTTYSPKTTSFSKHSDSLEIPRNLPLLLPSTTYNPTKQPTCSHLAPSKSTYSASSSSSSSSYSLSTPSSIPTPPTSTAASRTGKNTTRMNAVHREHQVGGRRPLERRGAGRIKIEVAMWKASGNGTVGENGYPLTPPPGANMF